MLFDLKLLIIEYSTQISKVHLDKSNCLITAMLSKRRY